MARQNRTLAWLAAPLALVLALVGCSVPERLPGWLDAAASSVSAYLDEASAGPQGAGTATGPGAAGLEEADLAWSEEWPDYYRVLGASAGPQWALEGDGGLRYGELDPLGRATWAGGWVTGQMRAEARARDRSQEADLPDPAGWPDSNPQVLIPACEGRRAYSGWGLNRSHLCAYSLLGSNDVENLVTGTRTQNVGDNSTPGGMAYTETLARDWLDASPDGALWYMAVPVYVGDEPVPRAVVVNVRSDDGALDQQVLVFNAAKGYSVDYATGELLPEG